MKGKRTAPVSVDAYIAGFEPRVQTILKRIRATIRKTAPGAEERISYQIPAYRLKSQYLVYFAAFEKHVSLYPRPRGTALEKELAPYASGRGTVKFQLDRLIPWGLVGKVVRCRIRQNAERAAKKR